jgi:predicted alpha/beta-hydrolase family hydrolase
MRFAATENHEVSALLLRPPDARWFLVLGHGAGAGMRHTFLESIAARLAERQVATFRYQFAYMEEGRRTPDRKAVLHATVRSAVAAAIEAAGDLPILAGGKSMGGRMTSEAHAEAPLPRVRGLVFFGFPLHPPGKPGTERAEHLAAVREPMLFLQGTRDTLADLEFLRPICAQLGERAELHVVEEADHSFHVSKRSGKTNEQVLDELADRVVAWGARLGSKTIHAAPVSKRPNAGGTDA